jgi:hypothetical protein
MFFGPRLILSGSLPQVLFQGHVMRLSTGKSRLLGTAFLFAFLVSGCSSELNSPTARKLKGIANLYCYLAASNKGTGPKTDEEVRKFVLEAPDIILTSNRIEVVGSRQEMLVSDRDGQPFVIKPEVSLSGMTPTKAPLVAYENTGKNGKHLVVYANFKVEEVSADTLQELNGEGK